MQQWVGDGVGICGGRVLMAFGDENGFTACRDGVRSVLGYVGTGWCLCPHKVEMVLGHEGIGC